MTPKLYKAADVCELTQLQPYVLRSWEKEFPGIGVQKPGEGTRLYRQSDVDQVLRIKQLVFGEGLTLSGARRRLEGQPPIAVRIEPEADEEEPADEPNVLDAAARETITTVRDGLRVLLDVLSRKPAAVEAAGRGDDALDYELRSPSVSTRAAAEPATAQRALASRGKATRAAAKPSRRTETSKKTKRVSA